MADTENINFPTNGFEGLIFDLDGTLVDSMPAHFAAWCEALASYGAAGVFQEDVFYAMGGRPTQDIVRELNSEYDLHLDPESVAFAKRECFMRHLERLAVHEEVVEFARTQYGKVPMAVATGGTRIVAEKTLQATGLSELFDDVVTADDVKHGKPDPEVYLRAAERIGVAPEKCLALEDAPAGIMSAQAAGMEVVTVPAPCRLVN
jgi:beta-phosphoglucomutase family hydrolase